MFEVTDEQRDLGTGGSPVGMQLVDHQREPVALVGLQPGTGAVEKMAFPVPKEHHVEHRIVSDQDVRGCIHHVPPRPHLGTVEPGHKELAVPTELAGLPPAAVGGL